MADEEADNNSSGEESPKNDSSPKVDSGGCLRIGILAAILLVTLIIVIIGLSLVSGLVGNNSGGENGSVAGAGSLNCPTKLDPVATGQCIDDYIKSAVPGSPMIGQGKTFVTSGQKYNVNPGLMVAIGQQESSFGSKGVVLTHPYNYYGMTAVGGGFASYASWDESINNHARYLREKYLDKGLVTIEQIGAKYAPVGAGNDPTGLNNHWVVGVKKHFGAVQAKCPALVNDIPTNSGSGSIVDIAIGELGVQESGRKDCGPPTKYTGGACAQWCAYFVTWVYKKAGYNIPSIGGAKATYDWFGKNQINFTRGSATPQPGDVILFSGAGSASGYHIGLVEKVENNRVHTIEGNINHIGGFGRVARQDYSLNYPQIVGYGRWKK